MIRNFSRQSISISRHAPSRVGGCLGAHPHAVAVATTTAAAATTTAITTTTRMTTRSLSVSAKEVEKFNAMHADWWKPGKNPLISMNAIRVKYMRQQIDAHFGINNDAENENNNNNLVSLPLSHLRALDIGCGGGLLSESLARLGADVVGIDPSVDLVVAARTHARQTLCLDGHHDDSSDPFRTRRQQQQRHRLEYRNTTAEELVREGQSTLFDVVCLLEVVEHVRHPESLLQAAADLVRPGGLLFLSTMNRTCKAHVLTIWGAEYIMGYLPPGTHDWTLYRSPEEIMAMVQPFGMRELDTTGMVLERPPIISFDWALDPNDTDVNWIGSYVKQ